MNQRFEQSGPLVTVLIPTFNRRNYLPAAIGSVVEQTYRRLQIIVVNDGGESVRDIIRSFNDSRIILLERTDNRGKACSLNEALQYAEGKYVAYLDDDDIYYPHHIETLLGLLEGDTGCGAAYSDLYKTHCRILPDGTRQVLGKVVKISRDFDRWLLLHFNHVLGVSLMHRTDLLDKTGPYNESIRILIDWDMTRRLAFFTDFAHTNIITGEFFGPVGECDRISYRMRLDRAEYLRNVLMIRSRRPPKPWPKVKDLSIILLPDRLDDDTGKMLRDIWLWTFTPYQVILPLPADQLAKLSTEMPNILKLPVPPKMSRDRRIDEALKACQGDYIALVPKGTPISAGWVEAPMHALVNSARPLETIMLQDCGENFPAAIYRRHELNHARAQSPNATVKKSAEAVGLILRKIEPDEFPFQFDDLQNTALSLENEGDPLKAAMLYEEIYPKHNNTLWMKWRAARALSNAAAHDDRALELCQELNLTRPTVDTLMLEAKLHRRADRIDQAVGLLREAQKILRGRG